MKICRSSDFVAQLFVLNLLSPLNEEDDKVDEGGKEGQGHDGHRHNGHRQRIDGLVVRAVPFT